MSTNDFEGLKAKLQEFVQQNSIRKFESDDIIELVKEGEAVDWIVDQLKSDSPAVDVQAATALLTELKGVIAPETTMETAAPEEAAAAEPAELDLSQLDLSQLSKMLPAGMKLPPGFSLDKVKEMLESPQGRIMSDFALFCQENGVDMNETNMNMDDPRTRALQKEWQSTPREAFEGKTPAEMLANMPGKIATYRREEPRVGRNDPCPCGSGKKYKKCCGRP